MLLNLGFVSQIPSYTVSIGAGIIFIKFFLAMLSVILLGLPMRIALLVGFALCQIGEFSFILSKTGMQIGLIGYNEYQSLLSVTIFTMIVAPFIIKYSPGLAILINRINFPDLIKSGYYKSSLKMDSSFTDNLVDHLIIVGYGLNGRNVSRSTKSVQIPYVIIEMNPDTVKKEQENGESIFFGDASREGVLRHARIDRARIIVIAISDAAATRRIAGLSKKLNPLVHVIARTRYVNEVKSLYKLGTDEVIPEEFETSVEIFTRVLNKYRIPQNDIKNFISQIRSDGYSMYRSYNKISSPLSDEIKIMGGMESITYRVEIDSSASNKLISELNVRKEYGVSIIGIYRNETAIYNPDGDSKILPDDVLLLIGSHEAILRSIHLFTHKNECPPGPEETIYS